MKALEVLSNVEMKQLVTNEEDRFSLACNSLDKISCADIVDVRDEYAEIVRDPVLRVQVLLHTC